MWALQENMHMKITEAAKKRYSTKKFEANQSLSPEQLADIQTLLRLSPSSVNAQPWHFLMATTEQGMARVASAAQGPYLANQSKILQASLSVVLCVKTDLSDAYLEDLLNQEEADGRIDSDDMKDKVRKVRQFYVDLHRVTWGDTQAWMEKQVYLNFGALLLGVGAMGLDAVPIEGVDLTVLDAEFDLGAQGYKALAVVAIGHRASDDFNANLPKSRWPEARIFTQI
jgi:nitroreductase/dihydropteridine reductase